MTSPARIALAVITKIPPDLREALGGKYELIDIPVPPPADDARLKHIGVVVTTSMAGASAETMDAFPALGLIACNGAGVDKIDLAHAAKRNIRVVNTPDELTEDTADFAIALMYAVSRKIVEADGFVRSGRWASERMAVSQRVGGKTLGIVGLGKIGQVVAQRAAGLGMRVLYQGRQAKPNVPYTFVPTLSDLASQSDVLVLTCPGGDATHHIINQSVLERLGPRGILINIARGSVVDEEALLAALEGKKIYGAGLDVFASEPNLNPRFLLLSNAVLAPHYASLTAETRKAIIKRLDDAVSEYLSR